MKDIVEEIRNVVEFYKEEINKIDSFAEDYSEMEETIWENFVKKETLQDFIDSVEDILSYYE